MAPAIEYRKLDGPGRADWLPGFRPSQFPAVQAEELVEEPFWPAAYEDTVLAAEAARVPASRGRA